MPETGDAVRVAMTKWPDSPHWTFAAVFLGTDEQGDWFGIPSGTSMARPGARFVTETDQVGLAPHGQGWVATFHAPGYHVHTYVDMTTPPEWVRDSGVGDDDAGDAPWRLTCVDLDLDVIRLAGGRVFVDDEDEFDEHRVSLGYPEDVVSLARGACAVVLDAVEAEAAPFDGASAAPWFAALDRLDAP